jgi:uncharacterized protein
MKRVIFDTNVLISAILRPHSTPGKAVEYALSAEWQIIASNESLNEFETVALLSKFDRYASTQKRGVFVRDFAEVVLIIPIVRTITICRDPKDNKFLELAASGGAHYLITGDKDLLELHPLEGTDVVTPLQFLQITQSFTTDLE